MALCDRLEVPRQERNSRAAAASSPGFFMPDTGWEICLTLRVFWQKGYGVFSVGMSQKDALLHYLDNQEEHDKTQSFQDEYRAFLSKYGIEFDERYVWD